MTVPTPRSFSRRPRVLPARGGKGQAVDFRLVQQHAAQAAGEGHGAQPVTPGQPGMQQVLRHLHHVIESGYADRAVGTGDGVEGGDGSRQTPRMGHGRRPAVVRGAELDHDHRLAGVLGRGARRQEPLRLPHRLQVGNDHPDLRIAGEVLDVVGGLEPGLVAAGDDVAHVHAALFERAFERHHQTTGLPDDGDGAGFGGLRPVVGHGDELLAAVEVAEAVGPGHGDPRFPRWRPRASGRARWQPDRAPRRSRTKPPWALRAPAAAPSRRVASTNGAGTNTARWSGGSGSSSKLR